VPSSKRTVLPLDNTSLSGGGLGSRQSSINVSHNADLTIFLRQAVSDISEILKAFAQSAIVKAISNSD